MVSYKFYTTLPYIILAHYAAMPYISAMQTVIETPNYLTDAKAAGLSADEMATIVETVALEPEAGDVMAGTGGARKLRHARAGQGKSGGFRTIHYFGGSDVPVFLLAVYGKNQKGNLSKSERNQLAVILPRIAAAYRKGSKP